jgi:hypothetical protein
MRIYPTKEWKKTKEKINSLDTIEVVTSAFFVKVTKK